jgi:hypothetical protein
MDSRLRGNDMTLRQVLLATLRLSSMIMVWAYGVEEKGIEGGRGRDSSQKGGKKYVAKGRGSWYK